MVHDRLAMYFNYDKATHAICLAHVLRELEPIGIRWDQGWANDMGALLKEMNNAAHAARGTGATRSPPPLLKTFLARYDTIVEQGLSPTRPRATAIATTSNANRSTSSPHSKPSSPRRRASLPTFGYP